MISFNFQRQEFKYLLSLNQYYQVNRYLQQRGLTPDPYFIKQPNNNYYIASLYLDTPDYQAYWEKMYGVANRTKYRLRAYSNISTKSTPIFWEIKRKFSNYLKKDRFCLSWEITDQFLNSRLNLDQLIQQTPQQETLTKFYFNWVQKYLKPTVLISYWREALFDPFYPHLRLSFDNNIQATATTDLFCSNRQVSILPDQIIMELKFNGPVPEYLNHLCQYFNFSREAISKYCLAMEACGIVSEENK